MSEANILRKRLWFSYLGRLMSYKVKRKEIKVKVI